ncbi:VirB8 protein [Cohaesibacter marisflavi]|uniref:VirB8 protein n=1 Tax=Cohaesibacter marisflavi TaxID=655353 RepID=A0A1I5MH83_9HYPH|nr:VirB8/TrbF family protein [Cohaesibacter marisflavi]SFP08945.1 VirB8 protein [Cohaesibacter marisflavi]
MRFLTRLFRRLRKPPDQVVRIEPVERVEPEAVSSSLMLTVANDEKQVGGDVGTSAYEQQEDPAVYYGSKLPFHKRILSFGKKQSTRKPKSDDREKGAVRQAEEGIGNHRAVLTADPFAFKTAARRNAFFLRFFVVYSTAATLAIIVLVSTISELFPLKTTEFALLRVDPNDDRIYSVEPVSVKVPGYELMVEKIARRYVRDILAIDDVTQNERFNRVRRYSDSDFFNAYLKANKDLISRALGDGLNRSITVVGANKIVRYDDIYQFVVEFIQTDKIGRDKPKKRHLRAYLELEPRQQDVQEVDKFENPLGIRVLNMAVKEEPTKNE